MSSACKCLPLPATKTVTDGLTKTFTGSNAVTTTVTSTHTFTSEQATPSCTVTSHKTGKQKKWLQIYVYCNTEGFGEETGYNISYDDMTTCQTLRWCAAVIEYAFDTAKIVNTVALKLSEVLFQRLLCYLNCNMMRLIPKAVMFGFACLPVP